MGKTALDSASPKSLRQQQPQIKIEKPKKKHKKIQIPNAAVDWMTLRMRNVQVAAVELLSMKSFGKTAFYSLRLSGVRCVCGVRCASGRAGSGEKERERESHVCTLQKLS